MRARILLLRCPGPAIGDRREQIRRTRHGTALQIVQHAADAAHFLDTTGATRSAVHEMGEWRAVAGRFLAAVTIRDPHAAVIGRDTETELRCDRIIGSEYR